MDTHPPQLEQFLQMLSAESHSTSVLRQRFEVLDIDSRSELYRKAACIVRAIDGLFEIYGALEQSHAEWIQQWVLETLLPAEFKRMAQIVFQRWATPERLEGPSVPHINIANDALGDRIVRLARTSGLQHLTILDLGAGTLGTVSRVLAKLAAAGLRGDITAVEFTPALLAIAHDRAAMLSASIDGSHVVVVDSDMHMYLRAIEVASIDAITCSYALHHLHPDDQFDLAQHAYRCITPGGAFLVADPQEGKSDFNLKVLLKEEPEAVFAAFSSPERMAERLMQAGFSPIEILTRDDLGYTGFALAALKSDGTA